MISDQGFSDRIEKEILSAEEALRNGNDGRARVCSRRAAGEALTWLLTKYPRPTWKPDALSRLQAIQLDSFFPREVQNAAERLTTKVTDRFEYPFSENPIDDAKIIIEFINEVM